MYLYRQSLWAEILADVMSCSLVEGYQLCLEINCHLSLVSLRMEATTSFGVLVPCYQITQQLAPWKTIILSCIMVQRERERAHIYFMMVVV